MFASTNCDQFCQLSHLRTHKYLYLRQAFFEIGKLIEFMIGIHDTHQLKKFSDFLDATL